MMLSEHPHGSSEGPVPPFSFEESLPCVASITACRSQLQNSLAISGDPEEDDDFDLAFPPPTFRADRILVRGEPDKVAAV